MESTEIPLRGFFLAIKPPSVLCVPGSAKARVKLLNPYDRDFLRFLLEEFWETCDLDFAGDLWQKGAEAGANELS